MASATQNLTTYYAKRIIGDAAAASETSALLQTGTGVDTNTWILHRTNRNNLYGIKYLYDNSSGGQADKIELYGGNVVSNTDTPTVWAELDTGDVYIMGKVGIGYNPNSTGNTYSLYVNGNSYLSGSLNLNDHLYLAAAKNIYMNYNSTDYGVLINYDNSNTSLNACGGGIHIGYINSPYTYIFYSPDGSTRTKFFEVNSNGAFAATRFGVNGQNTSYNFYVNGTSYLNGTTYVNGTLLMKGTNLIEFENSGSWGTESPTFPNNRGGLYWSGTSDWVKIFCTETSSDNFQLIFDFGDDTSPSMILRDRGTNKITLTPSSGEITSSGTIYANGGYLKSTLNGNTVQIGSQNTSYCHITNSANIPFWFNKDIWMEKGKTIGAAGTQYRPFQIYLGRNSTAGSNAINAANPLIEFSNSDRSQYGQLIYTDYDSVRAPDGLTWVGNQANSWFQAPRVFGAVWNDYAEYRETKDNIQPGRCVVETGHGDLILSTKRLQPGCEIVSDTFGFAIGETSTCKTPTACAGRVLAYLYEDKSLAKPGDPVCSGPNGTVSIMTHEEEVQWPSRIIATISEIPDYEEWEYGSADEYGNKEKLKVDGRIWIRVR